MIEAGDGHRNVDWYFQPLINPDGYEHSHNRDRLWRKNRANPEKGSCAGTDLNRNFGYKWGGQGASRQPCRETYAGSGPFSEPETAAIQKFITGKQGQIKVKNKLCEKQILTFFPGLCIAPQLRTIHSIPLGL